MGTAATVGRSSWLSWSCSVMLSLLPDFLMENCGALALTVLLCLVLGMGVRWHFQERTSLLSCKIFSSMAKGIAQCIPCVWFFRLLFLQSLILLVRAVGTEGDGFALQFCGHQGFCLSVLWDFSFVYYPLLCSQFVILQLHKEVRWILPWENLSVKMSVRRTISARNKEKIKALTLHRTLPRLFWDTVLQLTFLPVVIWGPV